MADMETLILEAAENVGRGRSKHSDQSSRRRRESSSSDDDSSERKEESKRSRHRERDRDKNRERNGEKERYRDKGKDKTRESRRSEREKSVDVKDKDKGKVRESSDSDGDSVRKEESKRSRHRERDSVKNRERNDKDRARDRRSEREKSDNVKDRDKDKEKAQDSSDSDDDSERKEELKRSRHRERDSDKSRERNVEKERHRDKDTDKARESRRSEREKSVDDKHRERDKRRDRKKDREEKDEEREDREKERERSRDREHEEREREREREREKEREREREREREKERERRERLREREKERERREREKSKERERRRREAESDDSSVDDDRRDRKRRRKEKDHKRSGRSSRHNDGSAEIEKKASGDEADKHLGKASTREEVMEEEHKKLDEEMEKRRRRVQEWQELKRKKEEEERVNVGEENTEEPKVGKAWTLEGESDDEEKTDMDVDGDGGLKATDQDAEGMAIDPQNVNTSQNGGAPDEEEEIDPLDAYMSSIIPEVEQLTTASLASNTADQGADSKSDGKKDKPSNGVASKKGLNKGMGRILPEDDESDYEEENENDEPNLEEEDDDEFMKRVKKTKVEKLAVVDHSKIDYPPFRRNFYIEVRDIAKMKPEEVNAYRKELELKVHGKDVPKPVKTWHQMGLATKILETIKKMNFEKPMPIQSQALPVIMSGRDCIGVAKTGSGKTLAFVLPMLRHIKDQPPLMSGDGPIGLIMAPTRELVQQIHNDIRKFTKVMGLTCVPVYGGSGVAQQISELKRGAEIVVCTPGRMIDILCTSSGKITNLRRVTYLVMDEADRMFDMGFEPQITRIVQNTRPDRQTVLFSATFPRQVEILARKVLRNPVEMQVGGRSVVNKDITQMVEMRPENERFLRLLEILGEWCEKGKILVFVHSQEKCDALFNDLLKRGYPCLSLHGGKDQTDRESTISDFKTNVCNILIATSIAARGLDVKELELVINFDVPNHYEDYVHRVGRTGRAGRKGMAITFISEEEARYAPDLLKALELSEQPIPDDLKALSDGFMAKVKEGVEKAHGTGYGGSGFKFNEEEDDLRKAAKKAQAKEYGFEEDRSDSEDDDEGIRKAGGGDISQATTFAQVAALAKANAAAIMQQQQQQQQQSSSVPATGLPNAGLPGGAIPNLPGNVPVSGGPAMAMAAAINIQQQLMKLQASAMPEHYEAELEINDFPQNARWKVTHKETLGPISEWTGAAITTRGMHFPQGRPAGPGERKLYLYIEGPTEQSVKRAKAELKRVLEDITMQATSLPGAAQPGRYSVL